MVALVLCYSEILPQMAIKATYEAPLHVQRLLDLLHWYVHLCKHV